MNVVSYWYGSDACTLVVASWLCYYWFVYYGLIHVNCLLIKLLIAFHFEFPILKTISEKHSHP